MRRTPIRGLAGFALKAGVSLLLLGLLLRQVDATAVAGRLGGLALDGIAVLAAILLVQAVVGALRWWVVIGLFDSSVSFLTAFRLLYIGLFFNQTLPSSIGGDAVRVWMIHREGLPASDALFSVALDRLAALIGLVIVVAASLPMFFAVVPDTSARWALAAPMGLVALGTAGLLAIRGGLASWLERRALTRPLAALAANTRRLLLRPSTGGAAIGLSLASHGLTIGSVFVLGRAIGVQLSFVDCLVLVPPVILLLAVPISFAGWGVRETAMVVAFGFVGVAQTDAVAVSVAVGLSVMAFGLPGGLLWLLGRKPALSSTARASGASPPRSDPRTFE